MQFGDIQAELHTLSISTIAIPSTPTAPFLSTPLIDHDFAISLSTPLPSAPSPTPPLADTPPRPSPPPLPPIIPEFAPLAARGSRTNLG